MESFGLDYAQRKRVTWLHEGFARKIGQLTGETMQVVPIEADGSCLFHTFGFFIKTAVFNEQFNHNFDLKRLVPLQIDGSYHFTAAGIRKGII